MISEKNIVAGKSRKKPVCIDVFAPESNSPTPVAIFFHGTKGFKDWGYWPFMYRQFHHAGIALITVNFSHNGVPVSRKPDITDAESFAQNTISLELKEMKMVIDWVFENATKFNLDTSSVSIIGHSRGGAEVLLYTSSDSRVTKVIAWAPVSDIFNSYSVHDLREWEKNGSIETKNTRTGMVLPVNFSFAKDILDHKAEFDVLSKIAMLEIPVLLIHGAADESVSVNNSRDLHDMCLHALLVVIQNAGHTFGLHHPWPSDAPLPHETVQLLENTVEFIQD